MAILAAIANTTAKIKKAICQLYQGLSSKLVFFQGSPYSAPPQSRGRRELLRKYSVLTEDREVAYTPSLDEVQRKYRSLKFCNIADSLHDLLRKAEDNEVSYPELADMFAEEELLKRERKRVGSNLKRSGFPSLKTLEEVGANKKGPK